MIFLMKHTLKCWGVVLVDFATDEAIKRTTSDRSPERTRPKFHFFVLDYILPASATASLSWSCWQLRHDEAAAPRDLQLERA